ncbi:MAG TPA: hypothetical protein VLM85_26530 [Polyangiaceae bacterium]|nr:hypothetical protein [Polyangiaceae bacterium]
MRVAIALLFASASAAACKTTPVPSDAGLTEPPASASPSPSASASPSAPAPPAGAECTADSDCGPASCCGPFMADARCVKTTLRNCQGVLCPQIVSDYACACRNGLCATVRVSAAPAPTDSAAPRPAK